MIGWGQEGPLAQRPGHHLNYLAVTGLLHAIGPADGRPVPPLNLVGDYGGGGMLLAFGIVAGLLEASRSGRGQVVDAAMVDGVSLLGSIFHGLQQAGAWHDRRESNRLDGGAPFYGTYQTSDGRWVAVAANEPKFYRVLVEALGLSLGDLPPQMDQRTWPEVRERFAAIFATRTRDEWVEMLEPLETCFAPVLTPGPRQAGRGDPPRDLAFHLRRGRSSRDHRDDQGRDRAGQLPGREPCRPRPGAR
jgi:alpha-methylacyl-CoA racemase